MKLTVTSCDLSKKTGKYSVKLFATTEENIGGITIKEQVTYYIPSTTSVKVGEEIDFPIERFEVRLSPYTFTNDNGEETTIQCKWLHLKR